MGHVVDLIERQDGRQDQAHLHHSKVLADTVACPCRERVERKILDRGKRRFVRDPALGDVFVGAWEVLLIPMEHRYIG